MKPYFILLALLFTLFVTAQEEKPKRNIFGADRMGLYVGLGTGYNTKINPNKYNWAKGLYLTQYSTIGYTYKNRFSVEYTHCFLYRTVKNVQQLEAGDSSYTITPVQGPPSTEYTSKFVAYDANAEALYSIHIVSAYISLFRLKRWGISYSFSILNIGSLMSLSIKGKDMYGNIIQYKPKKPYTQAYPQPDFLIPSSCISFDYYLNSNLNVKLNVIPYGFEFENTYSLGRQRYVEKGDDSGFLEYWNRVIQFNFHVSYYFLTIKEKSKSL